MIRRRLWAAWRVLLGRPFDIAFQWGPEHPGRQYNAGIPASIPALTVPNDREDLMLSIGTGDWLWDGKPFPYATVDEFILRFSDQAMTTVTVTIAVRMAGASPQENETAEPVAA